MNELKNCPFCGGEAEFHSDCDMVKAMCSDFDCYANTVCWFDEPEEAITAWNTRQPRFTPEEQEAMEEVLKMSELSGIVAAFKQRHIAAVRAMLQGTD